jgi:D-glycero-D-manno-heptose 1,7-bisphosphate phosphatase
MVSGKTIAEGGTARPARTGALFLDRDGVINVDRGYVHRIEDIELLPGILELARFWTGELRGPIVVVTNQSGIGRGLYDERAYEALTQWLCTRFTAAGSGIARVYHCPFHPEHGIGEYRREHSWRKPRPGMILQAAADLDLDLAASVLVGDRESDIAAAAAAGVGLRILLMPPGSGPAAAPYGNAGAPLVGAQGDNEGRPSCVRVADLAAALALIRAKAKAA